MGFLLRLFGLESTPASSPKNSSPSFQSVDSRVSLARQELTARIQSGESGLEENSIVEYYISESFERSLPYPCLFEWEFDMVKEAVEETDIRKKIVLYKRNAWDYLGYGKLENELVRPFNLRKAQYWYDSIIKYAKTGNIIAKAALLGTEKNNEYCALNSNPTEETFSSFKEDLESMVSAEDKEALWAKAFFVETDLNKKQELYNKAAAQNYSAAYEELYFMESGNKELQNRLALLGASCDDGPAAYWFQQYLASGYYYGDYGFDVDRDKAIYWAKKGASNGDSSAIQLLRMWGE